MRRISLVGLLLLSFTVSVAADEQAKQEKSKQEQGKQLVEAARQGDLAMVKKLLAAGADVNYRCRFNITAIWQASSKGHDDVFYALLEAGADVDVADSTWHSSPLSFAREPEKLTALAKRKAKGVDGKLNVAAIYGQTKIVKAILAAGSIDPAWLVRAKAHAKTSGYSEIVKLLEAASPKPLPQLPTPTEEELKAYYGTFIDDRDEKVDFYVFQGQLYRRHDSGFPSPLLAIGDHTFERGNVQYQFKMKSGKAVLVTSREAFLETRYKPVPFELTKPALPGTTNLSDDQAARKNDDAIAARNNWPSFRGIGARGIATGQNLPKEWDVAKDQNVLWKTEIPGLANSCPIVWGDRVFVTTAVSSAGNQSLRIGNYGAGDAAGDDSPHKWQLICLDKATGKIAWTRTAHEGVPPIRRHTKSTQANPTPATDGKYVVASFASGGLYCYDMNGEQKWKQDLGVLDAGAFNDPDYQWGFGSSPIIAGDRVIVQCDLQKGSFLAAYQLETGKQIWRVDRDEAPSWGTPTVHKNMVITTGSGQARGYDVETGQVIWRLSGHSSITVPTPFVAHNLIYLASGYRPIQPIYAIRPTARGDISLEPGESSEFVAWSKRRGGPYLPTPLVYGNYLYICDNGGILTCCDAKTGKQMYRKRISSQDAGSFTASIVAADGRIYLTAESGKVIVVNAGPTFDPLALNDLGEYCLSTPSIAGGMFIARTQKHLVAIGNKDKP